MTSKLFVHTTLIEAPFLLAIPEIKEKAAESIFDFLLSFYEYKSRAVIHHGDERSTLWKCCSTQVQAVLSAMYFKRMEIVQRIFFTKFQEELEKEGPDDTAEEGLKETPADGQKARHFGRAILSTAEDGVALWNKIEAEKAAASGASRSGSSASPPPRIARASRMEEHRARTAAFRAEREERWGKEIQLDDVLEDEFVFRYGPATTSEALAYLNKVQMPRASNYADAFRGISTVDNYKIRFDRALGWCRHRQFEPDVIKDILIKNINPSSLRNIVSD